MIGYEELAMKLEDRSRSKSKRFSKFEVDG